MFSKEITSFLSRNSNFYNTRTMLRCLSLKKSPCYSLTWTGMIQIGLKRSLDFFISFQKLFFPSRAACIKRGATIKWMFGHLGIKGTTHPPFPFIWNCHLGHSRGFFCQIFLQIWSLRPQFHKNKKP